MGFTYSLCYSFSCTSDFSKLTAELGAAGLLHSSLFVYNIAAVALAYK